MIHVHGKPLVEFVKDVFICELLNLCSSKTTLSPRRVDVSPRGRGGCPAGETECFHKGEVRWVVSLILNTLEPVGKILLMASARVIGLLTSFSTI